MSPCSIPTCICTHNIYPLLSLNAVSRGTEYWRQYQSFPSPAFLDPPRCRLAATGVAHEQGIAVSKRPAGRLLIRLGPSVSHGGPVVDGGALGLLSVPTPTDEEAVSFDFIENQKVTGDAGWA